MHLARINFHRNIAAALSDAPLRAAMDTVKHKFTTHRAAAVYDYNTAANFESLRDYGKKIRDYGIAHMDDLLREFTTNAQAAGACVIPAHDGAAARAIITNIARRHAAKTVIKSKSMATEEIELNAALAAANITVTETDLGEFIIQLNGEKPAHIIAPAVHKTRAQVGELFHSALATDPAADIPALTAAARAHLRRQFLTADMGIAGANFLIADRGAALIVTNEGNGSLVVTRPRVLITVAGIDKIVARHSSIPALLALLTRSATGQPISNYIDISAGGDAATQHYIILLDNGRRQLRNSAYREMLRCIRCGACMNHCPVYHTIGGHAYGSVYMGPMGQVITPALAGIAAAPDLPYASTLCGACQVVCPVKIPLPSLMRRLRREKVNRRITSIADRALIALWRFAATRPRLYAAAASAAVAALARLADKNGQIQRLPLLAGWFNSRNLTAPTQTFRTAIGGKIAATGELVFPPFGAAGGGAAGDRSAGDGAAVASSSPPLPAAIDSPSSKNGDDDAEIKMPESPPPMPTPSDLLAAFADACRANSAEITVVNDESEVTAAVADYLRAHKQPPTIVCESSLAGLNWQQAGISAAARAPTADDTCGVTRAVAAAHTGAILITSRAANALDLSLLPPYHIAIIRRDDIVANVQALWDKLPNPLPRHARLVAGPSRTADIEQTLTLGAHGPLSTQIIITP